MKQDVTLNHNKGSKINKYVIIASCQSGIKIKLDYLTDIEFILLFQCVTHFECNLGNA